MTRRAIAPALALLVISACRADARHAALPIDSAMAQPVGTVRAAPESSTVTDSTTPDDTARAAMPDSVSPADSAAGESVFRGKGRCFTCHGETASGQPGPGPSLTDSSWLDADGSLRAIRHVVTNGVPAPSAKTGPMPAFGATLSAAEVSDVAAYVYAISHPRAVEPDSAGTPAGVSRDSSAHQGGVPASGAHDIGTRRPTHPPATP